MKKGTQKKTRLCALLVVTLICATALAYTVFANSKRAGDEVTQHSFDELASETKRLALDMSSTIRADHVILSVMADLLADQDLSDHSNPAVLEILRSLYREGTTILLITHDDGIAATARRVVRLSDGKIIADHAQEVDWE